MSQLYKKIVLLLIVQLVLVFPSGAQQENAMRLRDSGSWTMVLIPDPQGYVKFEMNQPVMDIITTWIKVNIDRLNIRLVMCTGDLVESNNSVIPDPTYGGDQTAWQQWQAISGSFKKLDHEIPYILCLGNHDMEMSSARYSQFNSWFAPDRNPLTQGLLVDMFPNASGVKTLENACYEFISPGGIPFLIFSLEFLPRDTIVRQAIAVAQRERYKHYIGIVLTHSYLGWDNNRRKKENYPLTGARGEDLWQQFVAPSGNIEMVLSGHIAGRTHREHVGYLVGRNAGGRNVHQIVFNAQWEGGGPNGNGGDGWIRIFEFLPDNRTVFVRTFSPLFAISPETSEKSFRTDDYDQFTFELD